MKILLIPDNPLNEIDSLVDIQEKQSKKLKDSRISTLIRIADYFNISLDELIGRKLED